MERSIEMYDDILDTVNTLLKTDTSSYKNIDRALKHTRLTAFFNSLSDDKIFLLFSKSKIKVFSAKTTETHLVSSSLFDNDLTLKHIFNNQTEMIKAQLWDKLFRLYIELDKMETTPNMDRLSMLMESLKEITTILSNRVKNDILKVNVNNTTNSMIDDIVGSFQNMMTNKANPFENIMSITTMISDKYKDQLQNGEIQLDKIIGGIDGVIPGLMKQNEQPKKEKVIIDENFSTSNVMVGVEEPEEKGGSIGNMMKMIPNMGGLMDMVSRINTAGTEEDLLSIKKDMDHYLEKELKVDMSQFSEAMDSIEKNLETKE
jgi:hypothetical protein